MAILAPSPELVPPRNGGAVDGRSNRTIAAILELGERTVETHLKAIYDRAQVEERSELVARISNEDLGFSTGTAFVALTNTTAQNNQVELDFVGGNERPHEIRRGRRSARWQPRAYPSLPPASANHRCERQGDSTASPPAG